MTRRMGRSTHIHRKLREQATKVGSSSITRLRARPREQQILPGGQREAMDAGPRLSKKPVFVRLHLRQSLISGLVSVSFGVCAMRVVGQGTLQTSFVEHPCSQVGRVRGW